MVAYFIVSIDTELKWGYRFYPAARMSKVLLDNEDKVISIIGAFLDLFGEILSTRNLGYRRKAVL